MKIIIKKQCQSKYLHTHTTSNVFEHYVYEAVESKSSQTLPKLKPKLSQTRPDDNPSVVTTTILQ